MHAQSFLRYLLAFVHLDPSNSPKLGELLAKHGYVSLLLQLEARRQWLDSIPFGAVVCAMRWLMTSMTDAQAESAFSTIRHIVARNLDSIVWASNTGSALVASGLKCLARDDARLRACMLRTGWGEPLMVPAFESFKDPSKWDKYLDHPLLDIYMALERLGHVVRGASPPSCE